MTPQQIEAMKLALDALKEAQTNDDGMEKWDRNKKAITALKEALAEHAMRETQRLGQEIEQEPPKYSFKAHWEKDGRIGVVGAVVRPDGGVHLLQDFIDPPQRTWVELEKKDMPDGENPMFDHEYFIAGMVFAAKVLKEKNT